MQWVSIFFAFLTRGVVAVRCRRLIFTKEGLESISDSTLAILDPRPGGVNELWLSGSSYLDVHLHLWEWNEAGFTTNWNMYEQALYSKIKQMSSQNPSIEDIGVVEAIVKDMRMMKNRVEMRVSLAGFDFPSLFKLCSKNEVRSWDLDSDNLRDTLISLLAEKVVPWITTTDHLSTIYTDVVRSREHQRIVYDVISSLEDDNMNTVIQSFNTYALVKMKYYVDSKQNPAEAVLASIDSQISEKLGGMQEWFDDDFARIHNDIEIVLSIIRSMAKYEVVGEAATIPVELLMLMRERVISESSRGGINYSLELDYIDNTLLAESFQGDSLYRALYDEHAMTILSIVKEWTPTVRRNNLDSLAYHDLLRLRTKCRLDDEDRIGAVIRELENEKFESWLTEWDIETQDPGEDPLGVGWVAFEEQAIALVEPIPAKEVLDQIIKLSAMNPMMVFEEKLKYMDYFSLLFLKHTLPSPPHQIPDGLVGAIDSLLETKKLYWMDWLNINKHAILDNPTRTQNLLPLVELIPRESWLTFDDILTWEATLDDAFPTIRNQAVGAPEFAEIMPQYNVLRNYFIEHLATLTSLDLRTTFADPDKVDQIVDLLDIQAPDTIQSAISHLDVYHLLVLHAAAADSIRVADVIHNLDKLEYLSLLEMIPTLQGPPRQQINSLLPRAKARWHRWFEQDGSDVITDRVRLDKLLRQLLLVPEAEYLLTPPEISRLGDQIREWDPKLYVMGKSNILHRYAGFIEHAKKYGNFRNSGQPRDEIFRTHIWRNEQNNNFGVLDVSVRFDSEIISAHRSEVYEAIDWRKVLSLNAPQVPDDRMQPPRKRQRMDHDSLASTFLKDGMELQSEWFKSG